MDYNCNGEGYKVISRLYTGQRGAAEAGERDPEEEGEICFYVGGNSTVEEERVVYLNFFPTAEQMENYTVGRLITSEVSYESAGRRRGPSL